MPVMRVGKVKGPPGPPGPGYTKALELEEAVADLEAEVELIKPELTNILPKSEKGVAGGVATLDDAGKVPSSQLPGYVDDVLEFNNLAAFPTTGETGKIYVAKNTNKTYRWSGTTYVVIGGDIALGETSATAYAGDKGKKNADDIAGIKQNIIDQAESIETQFEGVTESIAASNASIASVSAIANASLPANRVGVAGGTASLGADGKIPVAQIPDIYDDVLEFDNFAAFPTTGESGKLYVSKNSNKSYRWSGTAYIIIGADIEIGEEAGKAYPGNKGKALETALIEMSTQFSAATATLASSINAGLALKLDAEKKGVANGLAELGADGKIPASQLPSYVDDVLEFDEKADFPSTGESGKIYIDKGTNVSYRWSGSTYVGIGSDLALGETNRTAYPGNLGKASADNIASINSQLADILESIRQKQLSIETLQSIKMDKSQRGVAGGVASLDDEGKVPVEQIPIGQLGSNIGLFAFEVNNDGDLIMVYPDEMDPVPTAYIDDEGYLLIDIH